MTARPGRRYTPAPKLPLIEVTVGRAFMPDDRISHYRIVGPLGAGGMGEVYIAQDETLERSVALKILPQNAVRNEERLRRFITEAKSASSLNHPNIVTIYEIGQDMVTTGGSPASPVHFISMELVSGVTLAQQIHHEKADARTLLGWLAQAAEGVAKAHAAGIVHRDLKPGNIMISKDGFAKVLDFGLAKLTEQHEVSPAEMTSAPTTTSFRTDEGRVMGTVGYMSPEQVEGKAVDHRSDVFSMGCILYEAVTRRRPFSADTDVEVMHQILRERPVPIEELNREVPAEVRRLIRRCLAKSPDQRFQSMKDLAIDLREVVDEYESLSATATSASSAGLPGVLPRRRAGFLALVAGTAVVGLTGVALGLYAMLGGHAGAPAGSGLQNMKMSVLMSRSDLHEAVLSGDGRYLAYVTSTGDRSALNVRQVRTGADVQILPPQEFRIRGISFSPDGDHLYYLNQEPQTPLYNTLLKVASLGGTPRKVAFDSDSRAAFSPDGRRICFRRGVPDQRVDSLVIAELDGGRERELIRVKYPDIFSDQLGNVPLAWSPDGRRIATAIFSPLGGARTSVVSIDVESGARTDIGSQPWLFVTALGWLPDGSGVLLSAEVFASRAAQIYRLSYPDGEVRKLTSDLNGYGDLSVSSDGRSLAAIRWTDVKNVWVATLDAGGAARPVTFASGATGSSADVAPMDDGGIAFLASGSEGVSLWRMEPDGSGRRQLTSEGTYVFNMGFAGGAGVVFTQTGGEPLLHLTHTGGKPSFHLWRIDPDGGGLEQLTDGSGEFLETLSPNGKTVVFRKLEDPLQLWSMELDGGAAALLGTNVSRGSPRFAPDGLKVLYSALDEVEGRLYARRIVSPLRGGEPLANFLLPPGASDVRWAPDGRAVTYIDRDKGHNLMRQAIEGGLPAQLTRFDTGRLLGHEWSPDGTRAVLHRLDGERQSLWTLAREDGAPEPITQFETGEIRIYHWARDSRSVVFTYGTSSQDVVLITDFQ